MSKVNISQSLIKRIWEYKYEGKCGFAVKNIDLLKKYQRPTTPPMKLGNYFEYIATGQTLRDGSVPEAPVTNKKVLTADGKRASAQATNFTSLLESKGIEVLETGVVETIPFNDKYNLKSVKDAVVKTPDYDKATLDLKFTALLHDKWKDVGWDVDKFRHRSKLNIQPLFYKYIDYYKYGITDYPFFYAIHSSKNENDYDFWEVEVVGFEKIMSQVEDTIHEVIEMIENDDFLPIPEMNQCRTCPLKDDCVFKELQPKTKVARVYAVRDEIE